MFAGKATPSLIGWGAVGNDDDRIGVGRRDTTPGQNRGELYMGDGDQKADSKMQEELARMCRTTAIKMSEAERGR